MKKLLNNIGLLFLLPIMAAVFYMLTLPVSFDEAATFLLFTNKGFAETVSHYPAPNNHVLHSVITNITKYFPCLSDLVKLRISALLVHITTLIALYKFVSTHFGKKTALLVLVLSSMLFLNIYYSYMSRGYSLVNLFFICNLFLSFNLIKGENTTKNWVLFSLFSILGFYTIPSYLYPFLTLNAFIFVLQPKYIWKQFLFGLVVVLIVYLLYLPIIINEGLAAITANPYVKSISFLQTIKSLPLFYLYSIQEITGIHWSIFILMLSISIYLILKSKNKLDIVFAVTFILAPMILLSLQCVIPFARVFNYYSFVIILLILLPFKDKIEALNLTYLLPVLLSIQLLLLLNFNSRIYAYENKDQAINITAGKIIPKIIGNKKYLSNHSLLTYNLEFELISKGYKNYRIKEVEYNEISADTISKFDYVIINKEADKTVAKKPIIRTDYYSVYKN
ncbi:hypothetical protein L1S35_12270 [Flavobacterium sp. AS60]|uniref:hypothetical protein n=1 Tax=Flavobacterium anseongense TaxID=2910677 RepID=UPI001F1F3D94|nr:hypothetical protein [Flavobacterium sp. AS60]MCF6130452.1 hypothetical protein [Flavobacterium sp. AS60]